MFKLKRILLFVLLVCCTTFFHCRSAGHRIELASKDYDLKRPEVLILNDLLAEISGIYFYAKDTSLFAISDEEPYLFKISLTNFATRKWDFGKHKDYEDVWLQDSNFYVLQSNGNLHELQFSKSGDTIHTAKSEMPVDDDVEFESLYFDTVLNKLVMICKDCKGDKKSHNSVWGYDPIKKTYEKDLFRVDSKAIAEALGMKKIKFKPSAATLNPITGDVWILSAINDLIAVTDRSGDVKSVYTLDKSIFNQPEGITFTPWGDLIISDEAGDSYRKAKLLIFKHKKNI